MVTWIALNTLTKMGALGTNIYAVGRLKMVTWIAYNTLTKTDALGTKLHACGRLEMVTWIAYNTLVETDALGTIHAFRRLKLVTWNTLAKKRMPWDEATYCDPFIDFFIGAKNTKLIKCLFDCIIPINHEYLERIYMRVGG